MRNFFDRVEDKIEVFFSWLNKEPKSTLEGFAQATVALGLFVTLFAVISLAGTFFI